MSSEARTCSVGAADVCSVDNCEDQARVKGMCTACYYRLYRTGSLEFASDNPRRYRKRTGRPRSNRLCGLPGCAERHYAKDLCYRHWRQAQRMQAGDTDKRQRRVPLAPLKPHLERAIERYGLIFAAERLSLTDGHLHHLMNRNKSIDLDTADRICIALGLPFDALFNREVA